MTDDTTLDLLWSKVITCPISIGWRAHAQLEGERESNSKSRAGTTFCDFRPYNPGDSMRGINFKMLARHPHRPMVTEFEQEQRVTVCLLADVGASMNLGEGDLNKRELAALLAMSIFGSAALTQDFGRLVAYSAARVESRLPESHDEFASTLANNAAEAILETEGSPAQTGNGLNEALSCLPEERSLVVIVSDFLWLLKDDNASRECREALSYAASKHEVICLVVQDEEERQLPDWRLFGIPLPGFFRARDAGGDEAWTFTGASNRTDHAARFFRHQQALCKFFDDNGCKYAIFRTEESDDSRQDRLVTVLAGNRAEPCLDEEVGDVYRDPHPVRAGSSGNTNSKPEGSRQ